MRRFECALGLDPAPCEGVDDRAKPLRGPLFLQDTRKHDPAQPGEPSLVHLRKGHRQQPVVGRSLQRMLEVLAKLADRGDSSVGSTDIGLVRLDALGAFERRQVANLARVAGGAVLCAMNHAVFSVTLRVRRSRIEETPCNLVEIM